MATVLCIDDEEAVLITTKGLLETLGHQVVTASSGVQGLSLLRHGKVDLLILDYCMVPMDGMAVADAARNLFPGTRILLRSGQDNIPRRLLDLVDAYVGKGSPVAEFISTVSDLLAGGEKSPQPGTVRGRIPVRNRPNTRAAK